MPYRTPEEQRWTQAIERADFGVWDLDPALELVHYSPQWKDRLGLARADVPDSTSLWRSRVHPDDLGPMLRALRLHLDGYTNTYEMRFRLRTCSAGDRPVLSRGRVVERNHRGEAVRMVGTMVCAAPAPVLAAGALIRPAGTAAGTMWTPLHRMLDASAAPQGRAGAMASMAAPAGRRLPDRDSASLDRLLGVVADLLDEAVVQGRPAR